MKKILLTITLVLSAFALGAQEAKTLFDSIPASLLPLLSPVNRADFIDFLESDMKAEVKNKLGGTSEMTDLTTDYIRIQLTSRSTWEMKTLPLNDSVRVISVVSTACGPVCDSSVRFYTSQWKSIPASTFISLPTVDDFFQLTDSARLEDYNRYRRQASLFLYKAEVSKESPSLTFTFTTPEYLGENAESEQDEMANTNHFIRPPLVYVWEYDPAKGGYGFRYVE